MKYDEKEISAFLEALLEEIDDIKVEFDNFVIYFSRELVGIREETKRILDMIISD